MPETLARLLGHVRLAPQSVLVREGDAGDRFCAIAEGGVSIQGRHVDTCGQGDGLGESALLGNVPRSATVTPSAP